ncbi:MAG TPA: prolipoprotein diacylglyceryl transferase [Clostridiaceae bacterium]|jgi:phosphatidylglycerol:prolipoprotein diacylglycerol transferase|nr:prolipoprotein diacylglyceryl transferase [Clostridiaceae bacterium]
MREVIEFPGLWDLKIPVSREAFKVFNIPIYWYGIIIAFAFLLAVLLATKQSSKYGIDPDNFIDLVLFLTPASIIGARLYYVAFSWEDFQGNFLDIINTRKGGLAIYGGIIAGLITTLIFAKVKKINVLELFDFGIPYLPMAQAIGRWGNFINQEAYGINTNLPWGMTSESIRSELTRNAQKLAEMGIIIDPSKPVHPTFLYESLWDLGVFLVLIWHRKRKKVSGEVLFLYMILYGIGRAWIEGLRTDSLMIGSRRISQLLSIVFAIVFAVAFIMRRRKASSADRGEIAELGTSSYGEILKEFKKEDHSFDFEEINDDESICEGVVNDATVDEETNNDEINDEEAIVEESIDDEANGEEINE